MNKRIAELRKELGLTQAEFSQKISLSRTGLASIERGVNNITDRTISDICRVFGVSEYWLRDGEGPMFRPVKSVDNELSIEIAKLINSDDAFTKQCVLQYLKLSEESKELFKNFLVSVVDGCNEENKKAAPEEPLSD